MWGATVPEGPCAPSSTRFNSRARVGRDTDGDTLDICVKSFNSRARVGRDKIMAGDYDYRFGFNSRARVGRDGMYKNIRNKIYCFNSRARVGRDSKAFCNTSENAMFQLTRPCGARRDV